LVHYIILYYYLLLLSFITQPNPTKPISNTTKPNQTQMFRAKKTKRNIKEHAEHLGLIEYCSALLCATGDAPLWYWYQGRYNML